MNKKQFFILSLLACPFLHQENVQAGFGRTFFFASVAVATGIKIYTAGEYNKTLSQETRTRLAKDGHPYLDATISMPQSAMEAVSPLLASAAEKLENGSRILQNQRETVVPDLLKKYNPFGKSTIQELEEILTSDAPKKNEEYAVKQLEAAVKMPFTESYSDRHDTEADLTRTFIKQQQEEAPDPDNASGECSHS